MHLKSGRGRWGREFDPLWWIPHRLKGWVSFRKQEAPVYVSVCGRVCVVVVYVCVCVCVCVCVSEGQKELKDCLFLYQRCVRVTVKPVLGGQLCFGPSRNVWSCNQKINNWIATTNPKECLMIRIFHKSSSVKPHKRSFLSAQVPL